MILAHGLCITTWWFCGTCCYISNHKGSFWYERVRISRQKGKELSGTRLDRLAKGAFVKVKHGMGCVDSCFFTWIDGLWLWILRLLWLYCNGFLLNNTWWWMLLEDRFFPQWGFPRVYLVSQFCGYVVYSLACGF